MDNTGLSFRHQLRINRAVNLVHGSPVDILSLDRLAHAACMSKYHFSRVFADYVGESPIAFTSRVTLEKAAYMLAFCRDWSINNVGDSCGFASNQTFARAFKRHFGFSPRDFREHHVFRVGSAESTNQVQQAIKALGWCEPGTDEDAGALPIKLVRRRSRRVAYVRNLGKYGSQGSIPQAYQVIKQWSQTHGHRDPDAELIGVSWDNARITPERVCRYDACISLPDHLPVPDDISVQTIPGGLYAVVRSGLDVAEVPLICECFLLLLKDWPRFKRLTLRVGRPYYEIFSNAGPNGSVVLDLYAPVSLSSHRGIH